MNRYLPFAIALSLLFSSCAPATQLSEPTSAPSHISTPSATATETPAPTATVTPTLSPDLNTYEFDDNVPQNNRDWIKEAARLSRYFLIRNLGSDLSIGATIVLDYDPDASNADLIPGVGYRAHYGQINPGDRPFIQFNVASPIIQSCNSQQFLFKCLHGHEFIHLWQYEHGCNYTEKEDQLTSFLIEGTAEYFGFLATGFPEGAEDFSRGYAFSFWPAVQFDENAWFNRTEVSAVATKELLAEHGVMSFAKFCDEVGHGRDPGDAFQAVYGISIRDFRAEFMSDVLGQTKDCTMATCGGGSAVIGQFRLRDFLDPNSSTPNLVAQFVDEHGSPLVISNILLAHQRTDVSNDNRQIDAGVPGIFSARLLPGRYAFYFCQPGYPGTETTAACQGHETDWFDIEDGQVTNITYQVPSYIEDADRAEPNLTMNFADENGDPVPDLRLQVCNRDAAVKVCSPTFHGKQTDASGIYQDSLRAGNYVVRFNWPGVGYAREWTYVLEVEVSVSEDQVTNLSYQFPAPNLIVKLTDAVGSPAPNHFLYLCNENHALGNCDIVSHSPNPWSWGSYTNQEGVFKAIVEPGTYFLLTDTYPTFVTFPTDYTFTNIVVASETETTDIEYQLK